MSTATINTVACRAYGVLCVCLAVLLAHAGAKLITFGLDGLPGVPRDQVSNAFQMSFVTTGIGICAGALIPALVGVFAYMRNVWAMTLGNALALANVIVMKGGFDAFDVAVLSVLVGLTIAAVLSRPGVGAARPVAEPEVRV